MFLSRNMKNIRIFCLKKFHFLVVKFSVYLNRRVFVMITDLVVVSSVGIMRVDCSGLRTSKSLNRS